MANSGVVQYSYTLRGNTEVTSDGYLFPVQRTGSFPTLENKITRATISYTINSFGSDGLAFEIIGVRIATLPVITGSYNVSLDDTGLYRNVTHLRVRSANGGYAGQFLNGTAITLKVYWELVDVVTTPSVDSASKNFGEKINVSLDVFNASYTHKIKYSFYGQSSSYNIAAGVKKHSFTVPVSWCSEIPNSASGNCTVSVETFNGSKSIGTKNATVKLNVPTDIIPTLGAVTANGVNQFSGKNIQSVSSIHVTCTGSQGVYGSTIEKHTVSCLGWSGSGTTSLDYTTGAIDAYGSIPIVVTVTDSRGRTASNTTNVQFEQYKRISIDSASATRADDDGNENFSGTNCNAVCAYTYTQIDDTTVTLDIKYRQSGMKVWQDVYSAVYVSGNVLSVLQNGLGFEKSYDVLFTVTDGITATQYIAKVPTAYVFQSWKAKTKCIGFGCQPSQSDSVEINSSWKFKTHGKEIITLIQEEIKQSSTNVAKNLLDNSNFANPVNQRGSSSYSTGTNYTIDRWKSSNSSLTINDGSVTVNGTIIQYVQGLDQSKKYTFCYGNDTQTVIGTVVLDSSNSLHSVSIPTGTWTWAALYEGEYALDALPAYIPKEYSTELLQCQRYYIPLNLSRYACFCTSQSALFSIVLPTAIRTASPSVVITSKGTVYCNGKTATVSNIACSAKGNVMNFTATLPSTTGISTYTGSIANANFALSADL